MMAEDTEIIFESWLHKLNGSADGKSTFRISGSWKKRYFILYRENNTAYLQYHDRKPKSLQDGKKEKIALSPSYTLEKCRRMRGKDNVCQVTTEEGKTLYLAAEDEKIFQLFFFFMQTQTRLQEQYEEECFVVRPDTSDDNRRIGARGNMCLLHLSKYGVTLALQLSKCVLACWPLSCIKSYETTGRGQFGLEAGRGAPCGQGMYIFNTRVGQENVVYDTLDNFVNEVAGLQQMVNARASSCSYQLETLASQISGLQTLTEMHSDASFIPHLKRISRDIYDHLSQHLGASTATKLNASSPDLLSHSPHNKHKPLPRSGSTDVLEDTTLSRTSRKHSAPVVSPPQPAPLPLNHNYTNDPVHGGLTSPLHQEASSSLTSVYLQMGSPPNVAHARSASVPVEKVQPPMMKRIQKTPAAEPEWEKPQVKAAAGENTCKTPTSRYPGLRQRLRSRSCDDLNEYSRMSAHLQEPGSPPGAFVYENASFAVDEKRYEDMSEETTAKYCYAEDPFEDSGLPARYQEDFTVDSGAALSQRPYQYAKALPRNMRKSLSNPDLLAEDLRWEGQGAIPKKHRPQKLNFSLLNRQQSLGNRNPSPGQVSNKSAKSYLSNTEGGVEMVSMSPQKGYFTPSPKSYFASNYPSLERTRVTSPQSSMGISASAKTRVFTRSKRSEGQPSITTATPTSAAPSNDQSPAVLLRRQESNPMHGRRLPSLPPGGAVNGISIARTKGQDESELRSVAEKIEISDETLC